MSNEGWRGAGRRDRIRGGAGAATSNAVLDGGITRWKSPECYASTAGT